MRHTSNLLAASIAACLLLPLASAQAARPTETPHASGPGAHLARVAARGACRASARSRSAHRVPHQESRCRAASTGHRSTSNARRTGERPAPARGHHVAGFNRTRPSVHGRSVHPAGAAENGVATIAAVLATPCENTELTPEEANIELVRQAVLCLINKERAQNGITPLQPDARLQAAAEGHSHELVSGDYFAHVSPSGETPVQRIRAAGYISDPSDGWVMGENLAWGTYGLATPQAIVNAWIASPEHLANILEAQYRDTGIGVTAAVPPLLGGGSPGATYAQEFGVIIH